jgi:hypothetical protein
MVEKINRNITLGRPKLGTENNEINLYHALKCGMDPCGSKRKNRRDYLSV